MIAGLNYATVLNIPRNALLSNIGEHHIIANTGKKQVKWPPHQYANNTAAAAVVVSPMCVLPIRVNVNIAEPGKHTSAYRGAAATAAAPHIVLLYG